jgi:SAM-dependent methyltransferase
VIFSSAFLLFQIQPIMGKLILPWFGGSAAVWSTCMVFFQVLLLLGYGYAHLTTRYLKTRPQAILHVTLLAASVFLLPIGVDAAWKPVNVDDPTLLIIGLMTSAIGLPYFLLASTGPLLQVWFSREKAGSVPYRLFALSNFGSMLGLVGYPILFEPRLTIPHMSIGWSAAYAAFALICSALALRGFGAPAAMAPAPAQEAGPPPAWRRRLLWATLAALPTILLMAITSHLTQDIAPIPLLWVLPLALYLGTFILCFEGGGWYRRTRYLPLFGISITVVIVLYVMPAGLMKDSLAWPIGLYCGALFVCCMVCHGELANLKPPSTFLTSFYLMIAAGGAAGGLFVVMVAPRVFNDDYELMLAVLAMALLILGLIHREPGKLPNRLMGEETGTKVAVFSITLVSILAVGTLSLLGGENFKARNFYGTVKVRDVGKDGDRYRRLAHGAITHGGQFLDAEKKRWPTSYYGQSGGAGIGLVASRDGGSGQRVGVVGLGAGTMAAYCRAGDYYRFYEINPLMIKSAWSHFSYLSDCPGQVDVVQGDARLSLEREAPQQFDVIVLDAFSGDAVPVHLLTREAFAVYFKHLRPGGILAVHTSNLHLDLVPVVKLAATHFGKHAWWVKSAPDQSKAVAPAVWVLVSSRAAMAPADGLTPLTADAGSRPALQPWTDDYSSIYGILK